MSISKEDKAKIRGIIKTYLILSNRECSFYELKLFINEHNFGLRNSGGVSSQELGRIIGKVNVQHEGIFRDVVCQVDSRQRKYYSLE